MKLAPPGMDLLAGVQDSVHEYCEYTLTWYIMYNMYYYIILSRGKRGNFINYTYKSKTISFSERFIYLCKYQKSALKRITDTEIYVRTKSWRNTLFLSP